MCICEVTGVHYVPIVVSATCKWTLAIIDTLFIQYTVDEPCGCHSVHVDVVIGCHNNVVHCCCGTCCWVYCIIRTVYHSERPDLQLSPHPTFNTLEVNSRCSLLNLYLWMWLLGSRSD